MRQGIGFARNADRRYLHRLGEMKTTRGKEKLSEPEIDAIVVSQAEDDAAWEKSIRVLEKDATSVKLPADLASRVAFLARLHRKSSAEDWLTEVIRERVELEEAAFVGMKREFVGKNGE